MTANPEEAPKTGRIEGGVDAIVIGASLDGLAAAALLGKAGLKTILLGAGGADVDLEPREFAPGFSCIDGEHLVASLDPELAASLELYRHGLAFANRRMDTVYYFSDGGALLVDGDLHRARESVAAMAPEEAAPFGSFLESVMDAGRGLRPLFEGAAAPELTAPLSSDSEHFLTSSVDDAVGAAFKDRHLKALLAAEASFRSGVRPGEPFGFAALLRRWAGEAAGLQGAVAYPEDGAAGVQKALRRAAQAAKVDMRPSTAVDEVLVEWDRAAGVSLSDGGQIRAPVVVNALPARQAFIDLVGPERLDIEFQAGFSRPAPDFAAARIHFALSGVPGDDRTLANLRRRLFYVPDKDELVNSYGAARRGEVAAPLVAEAIFPSAYDGALAPDNGHTVSAIMHPVPFRAGEDETLRAAVADAARETFRKLAPGAGERIVVIDVRLAADEAARTGFAAEAFAADQGVLSGWARSRRLQGASGIGGYFYCGPDVQIGAGLNGAAARRAARRALQYFRTKAHG